MWGEGSHLLAEKRQEGLQAPAGLFALEVGAEVRGP